MGKASNAFELVKSGISHMVGVPKSSVEGKFLMQANLFKEAGKFNRFMELAKRAVHRVSTVARTILPKSNQPSPGNR